MRAWLVVTILAGGCGRWGFTEELVAVDATDVTTASFGERTGATYANVATDTTLRQANPTSNYGAEDNVSLSASSTALLRFDTSALPPGTQILSAALDVFTEDTGLASGSVEVYTVGEAWTEGTAMGLAGTANWTMRTGAQAWSGAGAAPPSRASSALASFVPAMARSNYVVPLDASAVQGWVDSPATNFGVALVVSGSGMTSLQSRETTSATQRPLLVVSYR